MAAAAEKLRSHPGVQRREPLAKSTIGEIVTGSRLPSKGKLLTFLAVCEIAAGDLPQWLAAWERAVTADLSRPPGGIRVRNAEPRQLGVHAAIHVDNAPGTLPLYVCRDIDVRLRATLNAATQRGCFVLLIGRSSVGKTRTMYEAVLDVLPDWWLVHPDPDTPDALRSLAAVPAPRTVVWLDELQRYLHNGLLVGIIRSLLRGGTVLAATMWPDEYGRRIVRRHSGLDDPHAADREILELATVLDLAGELTAPEQARARELAPRDARLRTALAASDAGMTQVLAAGPQLVRWWEQAPLYARALITAAVDARRLGATSPLPAGLLAEAAPGYLTAAQRATAPSDWLQHALDYAATPLHGAASALTPAASEMTMGHSDGYTAADFLLQHARIVRSRVCPPLTLWEACLVGLGEPADLLAVGIAAKDRLLLDLAERFYRSAGDLAGAASPLSHLLKTQERTDEAEQILRRALSHGDGGAATSLSSLLLDSGRAEEAERLLRDQIAAGSVREYRALAILLWKQERFEEEEAVLRDGIAAGDPDSPQRLGFLLMTELRRPHEAEQLLRDGVVAGWREVVVPLAFLLTGQGRHVEAEQTLRDGVIAGDPYARFRLAELLQRLERFDDAERECREGIAVGDPMARLGFDRLLRQQERLEEAEQSWREGIINRERDAPRYLAELLADQGRLDEAERVLRDGIAAGHGLASDHLCDLLEATGRASDALELQRYGLNLDGTPAGPPPSASRPAPDVTG